MGGGWVGHRTGPDLGPSQLSSQINRPDITILTVKHASGKSATARFGPLPVVLSNQRFCSNVPPTTSPHLSDFCTRPCVPHLSPSPSPLAPSECDTLRVVPPRAPALPRRRANKRIRPLCVSLLPYQGGAPWAGGTVRNVIPGYVCNTIPGYVRNVPSRSTCGEVGRGGWDLSLLFPHITTTHMHLECPPGIPSYDFRSRIQSYYGGGGALGIPSYNLRTIPFLGGYTSSGCVQ